jgi:AraC family transcriptional regulator, arabinose operon regulatory protein
MTTPDPSPLVVTPAPETTLIVAGTQRQPTEYGRGFRPAGTRDWLLVATVDGLGYARAGREVATLHPGDLLLIAPGTPQEYGYVEERTEWSNLWVHFWPRPHWLPWLRWPQHGPGVMLLQTGEAFAAIEAELRRMIDAQAQPLRLRQDKAMNALERVLIDCDAINPLQSGAKVDPRIRKALEIVGERLGEPLSVDQLARSVGLSRSRFSVLFSAETRVSPQSYIEAMRMTRAAQLLTMSAWPVGQIAEEVGIPNAYYFSTRFRARYGVSPTAWRARHASP